MLYLLTFSRAYYLHHVKLLLCNAPLDLLWRLGFVRRLCLRWFRLGRRFLRAFHSYRLVFTPLLATSNVVSSCLILLCLLNSSIKRIIFAFPRLSFLPDVIISASDVNAKHPRYIRRSKMSIQTCAVTSSGCFTVCLVAARASEQKTTIMALRQRQTDGQAHWETDKRQAKETEGERQGKMQLQIEKDR